ncbi:uncharacterized protein J4E79_005145 [Alternaria viburni]|uniref:uncharacterized protein n=1 Tax=Alternaria viburni TaxID=566460 RepID=UPI0020C1E418|nr:uncharacterized protein J4E79_005145 [Alternaria viburni]KAI4661332.1 hypothetical protein J4E79_005145 [Alternaria viburni]
MPRNKYPELTRRRFVPSEDPCYSPIPRSELVFYNPEKSISQLRMKIVSKPNPIPDDTTLVVYIDARASYGVYFGPNSPCNWKGLLDESLPQTSTRAEIEALVQALPMIDLITHLNWRLYRIIIATDSSFLVKALSQWMKHWIERGGVGSNGRQVAHFKIMKWMYDWLNRWEDKGQGEIQLWHIPREMNREADALANKALDEA